MPTLLKKLPQQCDICKDKIGLYKPYYTIMADGHFTKKKKDEELVVLCPQCWRAYKDFLSSREEFFIYSKAKSLA